MCVVMPLFMGYELKSCTFKYLKWYFLLSIILLAILPLYIYIDIASEAFGSYMAFPLLTLVGGYLTKYISVIIKNHFPKLFRALAFLGQNTIYVLALHLIDFYILNTILLSFGIGEPTNMGKAVLLDGINKPIWCVPYTIVAVAISLLYVSIRTKIVSLLHKYANRKTSF